MRIAVNTRFLLPGKLEGIGYFTQEICRRLPAALPEADWLFCFDRPYDRQITEDLQVEGRAVFPPARHPLLWKLWFDYSLPRAAAGWNADVILHLDGYCSLRTSIPQVMVIHDIAHLHYPGHLPKGVLRYYNDRIPRFLGRAERVLTVSEYVKEDIVSRLDIPADKITVTCNGVRPSIGTVAPQRRETVRNKYAGGHPYFFYLGAIHPRKNVARLIRAYTLFREAQPGRVRLLLGGRLAWHTGEIARAHAESSYRDDIVFLGYLPEGELADLLGASLALVYPSLSEGFGVPLLEAMHAEVPIITSDRSSLPEVAGEAALLVDPERERSIADALSRIASEAGLPERLVAAGRRQREKYSWEAAVIPVVAALRSVVGRAPSAAARKFS